MGVKVTNNGFGTLSAGINSSATTVTVDSGQGDRFPTLASGDFFFATLIDTSNNLEIIKVTARSTDSMTVLRAQDNTTARSFSIGDRIELRPTAALFENAHLDNTPTSTGSFGLPKGTDAQEPTASTTEGHIRYNTDDNVVYFSNGTSWLKISAVQVVFSSISGNLYDGASSTLTLSGSGFGSSLTVNFTQSSDSINTNVSVTPASNTSATVTVPAAVFNNVTAGNVVTVTLTNADNTTAALTITAAALPTGGTISTYTDSGNNYRVHVFNSSANFVVSASQGNVDYMVVGGGGGGGSTRAGGGGAGGMVVATGQTLAAATYSITIGGGGNGDTGFAADGTTGSDTVFGSIQTCAGGGGGGGQGRVGLSGGSGGGGSDGQNGASGTSGQGNSGGNSTSSSGGGGGGGKGGAGEAGGTDGTQEGGDGGSGLANAFTGSSVTYAGGGGGGSRDGASGGTGAAGGGNGGINNATPSTAASANRGSGGGGGGRDGGQNDDGANGGSGIVVVRYII